jgi:hypothetical protein
MQPIAQYPIEWPESPTEQPFMNDNACATGERDTPLENFAAELTSAIYPIALRHGMRGSWIEVELGLWRALGTALKRWIRAWSQPGAEYELPVWREGLLADLTEGAFDVAVMHGINGSRLEVESDLYRTLRLVIRRRYSR